jgi:hypothetical protein
MARHAQAFNTPDLLRVIRAFNQAATEGRAAWQPALPLELAFLESLEKPAEPVPAQPVPAQSQPQARPPAQKPPAQTVPVQAPASPVSDDQGDSQALENGVTLESIHTNWKKVLFQINQSNPQVAALLRSGKLMGIKDGVLYFGLSEVLRTKLEKSENLELIEKALAQVMGNEVPFRCVSASGRQSTPPPGVDSDGMVATALRDLGGEIVDIQ